MPTEKAQVLKKQKQLDGDRKAAAELDAEARAKYAAAPKYFILQTLWSTGEGRHLMPGETSALFDLTEAQIAHLTLANVITPSPVKMPSAPPSAEFAQAPEPKE